MKKVIFLCLSFFVVSAFSSIENKACIKSSNFCSCYQKQAESNCTKLGGGPLCTKGMGGEHGLLAQTSSEIGMSGGTLSKFCHGSVVVGILNINPDDCMVDNSREFDSSGSIKKPDYCNWNS